MGKATLLVRVGEHGPVHKEGFARRVLDGEGKDLSKFTVDDGVFDVPNTRYYRQAVIDGDLIEEGMA